LGAIDVKIFQNNWMKLLFFVALLLSCALSGKSAGAMETTAGNVNVTLYQRVGTDGTTWDLSKSTIENTTGINDTTFAIYDVTDLIHQIQREKNCTMDKATRDLNERILNNKTETLKQMTKVTDVVTKTIAGVSGMANFTVTNYRHYLVTQTAAKQKATSDNLILTLPVTDENGNVMTDVTLYAKSTLETTPPPPPEDTPEDSGILPRTLEPIPTTSSLLQTGEKIANWLTKYGMALVGFGLIAISFKIFLGNRGEKHE
jgi:hypothetical protein